MGLNCAKSSQLNSKYTALKGTTEFFLNIAVVLQYCCYNCQLLQFTLVNFFSFGKFGTFLYFPKQMLRNKAKDWILFWVKEWNEYMLISQSFLKINLFALLNSWISKFDI